MVSLPRWEGGGPGRREFRYGSICVFAGPLPPSPLAPLSLTSLSPESVCEPHGPFVLLCPAHTRRQAVALLPAASVPVSHLLLYACGTCLSCSPCGCGFEPHFISSYCFVGLLERERREKRGQSIVFPLLVSNSRSTGGAHLLLALKIRKSTSYFIKGLGNSFKSIYISALWQVH